MRTLIRPLRAIPQPVADVLLALLLFVTDVVGLQLECGCGDRFAAAVALSAAFGCPLAVRRRWPVASWLLVGLVSIAWDVLQLPATLGAQFAIMIALYTVASYAPARHVHAVVVLTLVGIVGTVWWTDGLLAGLPEMALTAAIFAAPLFLGDGVRSRRAAIEALEDRTARLEREREALARLAVVEERGRIARDLHDVVAHHLSVMVIQSEAAAAVVQAHPGLARDRLDALSATGRQALVEMRRILGVLRQPDMGIPGGRAPQPDLDGLGSLLEDARATGLDVHLHERGPAVPVAGSTAVSAYWIVQEALTNTRRHAGQDARVEVTLSWEDGALEVLVRDDGPGPSRYGGVPGLGLRGMAERAAIAGGVLTHGRHPAGGFAVSARLPLDGSDVAAGTPARAAGARSGSA